MTEKELPQIHLFTDGACSGNPGPGGWAYILRHVNSGKEKEAAGAVRLTTSNRMELTAVISGLEALRQPCQVVLFTDSVYVGKGLSEWMLKWKANGWRRREQSEWLPARTRILVTFSVVMNKNKLDSLPSDVKKAMDDLRREQAFWTGNYVDSHVTEALKWSKEKYNLQIYELPASEKAEIPKLLKPLIDGYVKRVTAAGLPGDQIMKDVLYYKDYYEKQIK